MWKWIAMASVILSVNVHAEIKVLAFAGSTREGSYNKMLVKEAANIAEKNGATVTVIDLKDFSIPFFDEDLEAKEGIPPKVKKLRDMMAQSQLIMIASPEYNGSLSAVLKNTIDWASRDDETGKRSESLNGKKFVLMSASLGMGGGARGLAQLRTILTNVGAKVVADQVVVPKASDAFDAQGHLKDPELKQNLQNLVQSALQS